MIIDAHYHLEERLETVEELLAQMDQHSISRVPLMAPGVGLKQGRMMERILRLPLSERDKGRILGDNFEELIGTYN